MLNWDIFVENSVTWFLVWFSVYMSFSWGKISAGTACHYGGMESELEQEVRLERKLERELDGEIKLPEARDLAPLWVKNLVFLVLIATLLNASTHEGGSFFDKDNLSKLLGILLVLLIAFHEGYKTAKGQIQFTTNRIKAKKGLLPKGK